MSNDTRLIEAGFPCHQVGAETQRERGASSALPPLYFLHVWWARRPLTPSRAAIVASLDGADTDPETFVRQLGIERRQAMINDVPWNLAGDIINRIEEDHDGNEFLTVDAVVARRLQDEHERRAENREKIARLKSADSALANDPVVLRWEEESRPLPKPDPAQGTTISIRRIMGDPAHVRDRIAFAGSEAVKRVLGSAIKWAPEDLFCYDRAFYNHPPQASKRLTVLDPTSGGGSIPFEALRLGHNVIANELNPVATTILHATLDYPARFGKDLVHDIRKYGQQLLAYVEERMEGFAPFSPLPNDEREVLRDYLKKSPEIFPQFDVPEYDHTGHIFARQVTCPHCGGQAPLLNTCWLSKEAGDQWGVRIIPDSKERNGTVTFATYRVNKGKGSNGEDPEFATVNRGIGQCIHCRQAIDGDEIKAQARGESPFGKWKDHLYAIVAVRLEPQLDKHGKPVRYASGDRKGEIKTRKVRFFRAPNQRDLDAITAAEQRLKEKWDGWESVGFIPTERFPEGNDNRPITYGMERWCDMYTPRQLLGHLTLIEGLNSIKSQIIEELGKERGRAVVTYLQFALAKCYNYNSKLCMWHSTRGTVANAFNKHDFSLKWTFAEMIFTGPATGTAWGLSQITDAYSGIAELVEPINRSFNATQQLPLTIINGTAAHIPQVPDNSVDLVCMDPPYYNNVMYAELSDFFYVWQKRVLADIYPDLFSRRLTDKTNEAVANPARDGSTRGAKEAYERMMSEIFAECRRVVKTNGIMTMMFTHKEQAAWETLTRALIETGWNITAAFPVESEGENSMHQKDMAAAASSIFIVCRKRTSTSDFPAVWTGIGGSGVQRQIEQAVKEGLLEFAPLKLNAVDEMVASYGRALRVLSEQWPVMDGDEPVSPIRAMNEASRVVSENQITRITGGRIAVADLDPETAMALTFYGIWGSGEFSFDEGLNISKSLNIPMVAKSAGYRVEGRMIGMNQEATGRGARSRGASEEESGYQAPLIRKGSKLRLATPEEREERRLQHPQTDWDVVHGLIMAYRSGDTPVARAYLTQHASDKMVRILDLLEVWGAESGDTKLRDEARAIQFGLR